MGETAHYLLALDPLQPMSVRARALQSHLRARDTLHDALGVSLRGLLGKPVDRELLHSVRLKVAETLSELEGMLPRMDFEVRSDPEDPTRLLVTVPDGAATGLFPHL